MNYTRMQFEVIEGKCSPNSELALLRLAVIKGLV